jgi:FKBP-type peptidyl-prolyl cis-trans isomerase
MRKVERSVAHTVFALAALGLAACGSSTEPEVVFEVIEETTFDASLGVDLSAMTRTGSGVYFEDLVEGSGVEAVFGTTPTVTFTGWLSDGSQFDEGTFSFPMGNNRVVLGFEDGLLGTKEGGTRLMVIPPNRGYGGQSVQDDSGNEIIPPGSVLVFRVTVDSVAGG